MNYAIKVLVSRFPKSDRLKRVNGPPVIAEMRRQTTVSNSYLPGKFHPKIDYRTGAISRLAHDTDLLALKLDGTRNPQKTHPAVFNISYNLCNAIIFIRMKLIGSLNGKGISTVIQS